jgi:hypothetical protein
MRALGSKHAREQLDLEAELAAVRERIEAQRGEGERRRHMEAMKESLRSTWDELSFDDLRDRLREVVDRIEVDGEEMRLYLRP